VQEELTRPPGIPAFVLQEASSSGISQRGREADFHASIARGAAQSPSSVTQSHTRDNFCDTDEDDDGMEIDDTENIDLREETPNSQDARAPEPDLRDSQRG
jgi:hypothetical protein